MQSAIIYLIVVTSAGTCRSTLSTQVTKQSRNIYGRIVRTRDDNRVDGHCVHLLWKHEVTISQNVSFLHSQNDALPFLAATSSHFCAFLVLSAQWTVVCVSIWRWSPWWTIRRSAWTTQWCQMIIVPYQTAKTTATRNPRFFFLSNNNKMYLYLRIHLVENHYTLKP